MLHHLDFADPAATEPLFRLAKELQADTYEQLGYRQEIPQWRGTGDSSVIDTFASVMDEFDPAFNLATP